MGKLKLQLVNDRFQQPGSLTPSNVRPNRLQDSTELMDYTPPPMFSGGVCIPFLSKPVIERSDYSKWRTGKVRTESSKAAPVMDNKGRYYECGMEVKNIKFSERQVRSFDYGANEAARKYYCTPKRMDLPTMNRVMDNFHDVRGETLIDRVHMGKVAGGDWSAVPRMASIDESTAAIGPGHYDVHAFEGKYGPGSSNLLLFSVVDSGRGVKDTSQLSSTQRRKARNDSIMKEKHPELFKDEVPGDDILPPSSTLATTGGSWSNNDRWNDPSFRQEKYVKTSGLKLELDYDPHLDRSKLPPTFTTTPQRVDEPVLPSRNTDYTVDYGNKISIATYAKTSPIKYSMAFKSKAPVGMHIPVPTSKDLGGPGAFPGAFKSVTTIHRPEYNSTCFLSPMGAGIFSNIVPTDGMQQGIKKFSELHTKGPTIPKGGTDPAELRARRQKEQVVGIYPKLAEKLWPAPKAVEKVDPFRYLKAKIK